MTTLARRALLTILAAGALTAPTRAAEVSGRILGDAGKPVPHAVVRVLPDPIAASASAKPVRAETGDDGSFLVKAVAGDGFKLRVEADGYAPMTQTGIPAGSNVQLHLKHGGKITGIVRDRATTAPIASAPVLAWDKDAEAFGEDAYRKTVSGKDGRFVLNDLPLGKATVEARAARHAPAKLGGVAVPKSDLELVCDDPAALSGLVTDTQGDPVAGAEVKVSFRDASGGSNRTAKTGADGRYRFADTGAKPVTRVSVHAGKFLLFVREGPAPSDGVLDVVLEHGGSITGTVHGFDDRVPPSYKVSVKVLHDKSLKSVLDRDFSDPAGAFRLDELDPGTYTIEVTASGYAGVTKADLSVAAEQVADAGTLTLESKSTLRGRVVAARDRAPVPGVNVEITLVDQTDHTANFGGKTFWSETTGADGTFTEKDLAAGSYDVTLKHPPFVPVTNRISFQPTGDTPELVLEMYMGGSLNGTVLGASLDPVPNAHIVATPAAGGDAHVADTGPDGHYFMDGLTPGSYTVTRQREGQDAAGNTDAKPAMIREGETTTVDFDEKPNVHVTGLLLKGDTPIPDAGISFVPLDGAGPKAGATTRSGADGSFEIGLRHGGRYQVSVVFSVANAPNGHNVVTLSIPEQPEVRQDIVFNQQAIAGHVLDPDRKGVGGALVTAIRDGAPAGTTPRQSTTTTTADGSFRIEAIDPGTYRVNAKARGFGAGEVYPITVADDGTDADVELVLERGWIMRGRVLDPQGRGVPGALIVDPPPGTAESGYLPAQTDAAGGFHVTAPADGPVSVTAISPNFAPAVQNDVVQPTDEDNAEIVLHATPGGVLRIRVEHLSGGPVPGAQVKYQPVPLFPGCDVVVERNPARSTDADGVTVIQRMYPGAYVLNVLGYRGVTAVQATVNEGSESEAVLEVP